MSQPENDGLDHTLERWFHEALEQPAELREAYINRRCGGDQGRLRLLQRMVEAAEREEDEEEGPHLGDRYQTLSLLGEGGQGRVYAVRDLLLERVVAAKVLRSGSSLKRSRAKAPQRPSPLEAQHHGSLDHSAIVPVYDVGTTADGRSFFTMKCVPGAKDLLLWYREAGRDRERRLARLLVQACEALATAHAQDILHLDIKPSNVLVSERGEPFVVDWGLTESGGGTLQFLSPEQAGGVSAPRERRPTCSGWAH